ncbi:hypothetical protein BKA58DRAFT_412089 [Alternaria rosae]|uniref:uncharacterized protein n=1 Tax=Alternaria rosae TaxID=1187941 RepID=UPI001E8DD877|nr:uncharacterized protein BKA58DRAFT_412089 [Alternaria rosae]KAH6868260.1 hypothetical protein BKA58DRAFT_412089 [Alternaria rosae]
MGESKGSPFTASLPSHPSNLSDLRAVNSDSSCFITNLATELVHHIIDYIPPASQIDFAYTCKHLFACSTDVLKRHRDAYTKYGVSSDIDPTTVPTLLRSAYGYCDPILAWHVRSLEVWYDRTGWDAWKTLDFEVPVDQSLRSPITWDFIPGEIDDYLEPLDQAQSGLLPARAEEARTQIVEGHDIYLKALLIASCPRLRDVKFVMTARGGTASRSCLDWLEILINNSYNKKTPWGPGLEKLSSVAIGLPTGTWMDSAYHPNTWPSNTGFLMQLLRLPSLEKLYFRDCEGVQDDDTPWEDLLPAETSPIKHLFLDNCDELGQEFIAALIAAPSGLITASFRAGNALLEDADSLVRNLGTSQGNTLESLMFYDYHDKPRSIHGYRCSAFRPEELSNMKKLKHLCIDIQDIELEACYNRDDSAEKWESDGAYLERCFLESVWSYEVLILWGSLSEYYIKWEPNEEQGFEDAIISLIGVPGPEILVPQAVYLENVEKSSGPITTFSPGRGGEPSPNEKSKVWFRRAIEVARKRGRDLHTLTNRTKPRHQIQFPEAPDKYDLKTGPWGERPQDWVFNVYTGRREPEGLKRCGMGWRGSREG